MQMINFGSRRVGIDNLEVEFKILFGDDSIKVIHGGDPVPMILLNKIGFMFK